MFAREIKNTPCIIVRLYSAVRKEKVRRWMECFLYRRCSHLSENEHITQVYLYQLNKTEYPVHKQLGIMSLPRLT